MTADTTRPSRWPLLALAVLNCWDAGATLFFLRRGADELNPVMAWAYGYGWEVFLAVKGVAVASGVLLLAAAWEHRPARLATSAAVVLYGALAALHAAYLVT